MEVEEGVVRVSDRRLVAKDRVEADIAMVLLDPEAGGAREVDAGGGDGVSRSEEKTTRARRWRSREQKNGFLPTATVT